MSEETGSRSYTPTYHVRNPNKKNSRNQSHVIEQNEEKEELPTGMINTEGRKVHAKHSRSSSWEPIKVKRQNVMN